jgi:hypothetical protein
LSDKKLTGIFIQPSLALRWDNYEVHLQRMAALELKHIIFQWTTAHGYSLYPSQAYRQKWSLPHKQDWIGEILRAVSDLNMKLWLGLDACRTITEEHYDPVKGPAERCCVTASELVELYSHFDSFTGFYIPMELEEPPTSHTESLLNKIISHCHSLDREVLYSTRKPRLKPEGRHYEFNEQDQEWVARERSLHRRWASSWKKIIASTELDALLLRDDAGTERHISELTLDYFHILRDCPRLWSQLSIYRTLHDPKDRDPSYLPPADIHRLQNQLEASSGTEERIGFSYHDMEWELGERQKRFYLEYLSHVQGRLPSDLKDEHRKPVRLVKDDLLDKAIRIEDLIHEKCMLHDQIVTVVDTRYPLEAPENQWQEDSDWLTGLYLGAESFRYAATGDEEARRYAQASWNALHILSNISGIPGIVARHYRKQTEFKGDMGTGRKRWHRNKDDVYWIGDISRDQLSGHMFGLAAFYDLVASQDQRWVIEYDVKAIADLIMENDMRAVDTDGQPCIHANFWVSPLLALAFLKIAYHITRREIYQKKYLDLIDPHYFLGHALRDATVSANPFFQHYHHDSPFYHFLQYETDPKIIHHVMRCIELLYEDTRRHGNVYMMLDYQTYHPESEAGRKGIAELMEYDVSHLNVAKWDRDAREYIDNTQIPRGARNSLRYILGNEARLPGGKGNYIPMKYRPPKEFGWNYYSGEEARREAGKAGHHGINIQYSGVDYLLVYWMGRYHGIID